MEWDLGVVGLAVLLAMALGFGAVAWLVLLGRHTPWWVPPAAATAYFVAGLLISEVWFGWATEEDLQPNIDGLSFDEVLLIGVFPGVVLLVVARVILGRRSRTLHRR